jgi:endonuclease/exonuclease/phosphatase family metal-dependent hydrolase
MRSVIYLFLLLTFYSCNQADTQSKYSTSSLISKKSNSVLIVSWNIQDFGKTISETQMGDITSILKDADIIALQEVVAGYGGSQAVARLCDNLNRSGAKWDYTISDPTNSGRKKERYAFLWKTHIVKSNRKGNLVSELSNLVLREPFQQTFKVNEKEVTILNYHSRKHLDSPELEIPFITSYINLNKNKNIIWLGDFNLNSSHNVFKELMELGYKSSFKKTKTTLKRKCKMGNYFSHSIDHIFIPDSIELIDGGAIDFVQKCDNLKVKRLISDHLPVYSLINI